MHGHVAAVSVAVHQRVLGPASLIGANTAAADHLLHIILLPWQLVVRRQTTLAGDHLRRKRTCGGIRGNTKKKVNRNLRRRTLRCPARSAASGPARSKCHVLNVFTSPFDTVFLFTKTSTPRRDGEQERGEGEQRGGGGLFEENRKCVMTQWACVCACALWQEVR